MGGVLLTHVIHPLLQEVLKFSYKIKYKMYNIKRYNINV